METEERTFLNFGLFTSLIAPIIIYNPHWHYFNIINLISTLLYSILCLITLTVAQVREEYFKFPTDIEKDTFVTINAVLLGSVLLSGAIFYGIFCIIKSYNQPKFLLWACEVGNEEMALKFLQEGSFAVNATDSDEHDAVHYAMENKLQSVIEEMKRDPKWVGKVLLKDCEYKNEDLALESLKTEGIDLNAKDSDGRTPFYWACINNLQKVVEAMVLDPKSINFNQQQSFSRSTGFIVACYYNHIELVKLLIQNSVKIGLDLNLQNAHGITGFIKACRNKHHEIVDFITANAEKYNINLDLRDNRNKTGYDIWPEKFASKSAP